MPPESVITEGRPLVALSIRQPWAWLIANGHKNVENRTWPTKYRGRFLIHAALKMRLREYESIRAWVAQRFSIALPLPDELELGGIVGEARIVGCQYWHPQSSKWHERDLFGFYIADAKPMQFIQCRGALSFFKPKLL